MVDADYKFMYINTSGNGTASDVQMNNASNLKDGLEHVIMAFPDWDPQPNDTQDVPNASCVPFISMAQMQCILSLYAENALHLIYMYKRTESPFPLCVHDASPWSNIYLVNEHAISQLDRFQIRSFPFCFHEILSYLSISWTEENGWRYLQIFIHNLCPFCTRFVSTFQWDRAFRLFKLFAIQLFETHCMDMHETYNPDLQLWKVFYLLPTFFNENLANVLNKLCFHSLNHFTDMYEIKNKYFCFWSDLDVLGQKKQPPKPRPCIHRQIVLR